MLRSFKSFHLRNYSTRFVYFVAFLSFWLLYSVFIRQGKPHIRQPSVHLVLATVAKDDISWTKKVSVPNTEIVSYVADDQSALHHPPINKGNEAMIYLSYCYDYYDNLPDITIFTHGQDHAWHIDGVLDYSTVRAINSLDFQEVLHRQYLNLRLSWDNACPVWINTSVRFESAEFNEKLREEEPFVREAFQWFLPDHALPKIFSAPCCSQFVATRMAIHSLPRETYKAAMDWIENSHLPSSITGRVFERLWQYMFLGRPVDCPNEFKALCRAYHICFEDEEDWEKWRDIEASRFKLDEFRNALLTNGVSPGNKQVKAAENEMEELGELTKPWRWQAIQRGRSEKMRMKLAGGDF